MTIVTYHYKVWWGGTQLFGHSGYLVRSFLATISPASLMKPHRYPQVVLKDQRHSLAYDSAANTFPFAAMRSSIPSSRLSDAINDCIMTPTYEVIDIERTPKKSGKCTIKLIAATFLAIILMSIYCRCTLWPHCDTLCYKMGHERILNLHRPRQ